MRGAYYNYAIDEVKEYERNHDLVEIDYGRGKKLRIYKQDLITFFDAIIPQEEREMYHMTDDVLKKRFEENGVQPFNNYLKGRCMIMVTDFENYAEYANGEQNDIIGITCMNIKGELEKETAFNYASKKPSFEEIYPDISNDEKVEI